MSSSQRTQEVIQECVDQAWRQIYPKTKGYTHMPALRPAPEALLSEQQGWAIYTVPTNGTFPVPKEANTLVHLECNRHWPNWWLASIVTGGASQDPGIHCPECKVNLPLEVYHIFWGAYRLLNMKSHG